MARRRSQRKARLILLLAGLSACDGPARPSVPVISLQAGGQGLDSGYTYLSGARELTSGDVIVSDPREARLERVSFERGSVRPVARQGAGPNEWSIATPLLALGGDSSLQIAPMSRRWAVYAGDSLPLYDVIDRRGQRRAQLRLNARERLVLVTPSYR